MKKFKTTVAEILAACALFNFTGCAERQSAGGAGDMVSGTFESSILNSDNSGNSSDPGTASGGVTIEKHYDTIVLSDSNTLNSIRLYDALASQSEQSNTMFSPLSLNMALGLVEAGANGETKATLDSYLQTENFSDFAQAYMKLAKEKYTFKDKYNNYNNVFEIANSLWADHALPLRTDYKQRMSGKFDAEIQSVDFKDKDKTLEKINGWVKDKTHDMIPTILKDYDDQTAAVLINTIYFESAWREKWYINDKDKEAFTLSDGTAKNIPLMYNGCDSYFENDKATAFGSYYVNGLQFIGILPKESGEFTLEGLDIPSLLESKTTEYDVSAVMPCFTFDTAYGLKEALSAAGLENIFDEENADFSGITGKKHDLWVSEIIQKTRIELDENGTKAAAVTAVSMDTNEAMPELRERKTVRLDRSFAFIIYDSKQDVILFMGKVTEP